MKLRRNGQEKEKKENKKKAEKQLKAKSSEGVIKLKGMMAPERTANISDQELISNDCFNISAKELEKFNETKLLRPRFHLKELEAMIEQEMFKDRSKAIQIKDHLTKIASATAENNKKERNNRKIQ